MESQKSISDWAVATFGSHGTNASVAARANQEMAELLRAVSIRDWQAAKVEAADCAIVLMRLATRFGLVVDWALLPVLAEPSTSTAVAETASNANTALARAMQCIELGDNGSTRVAVIDCLFWLRFVALCLGTTLGAQVDAKMAINRARKWDLDGHGHGYHAKAPDTPVAPPTKTDVAKILPRISESLERLGFSSKRPCIPGEYGVGGMPLSSLDARNLIDELGRLGIAFVEAPIE